MKNFLKLSSLVFLFQSLTTFAGGPDMFEPQPVPPPPAPKQPALVVYMNIFGLGSRAFYRFCAEDNYSTQIGAAGTQVSARQLYTGNATQSQFGVGAGLGFGHSVGVNNFGYFGIELAGQYNGGNAQLTWVEPLHIERTGDSATLPENIENKFEMKYQISIPIVFGVHLLSDLNLFYVKAGPSFTKITESVKSSIRFSSGEIGRFQSLPINHACSRKSMWGGLFGIGLKRSITKYVGVFAEYDYYYYGTYHISPLSQNFSLNNQTVPSQSLRSTGVMGRGVTLSSNALLFGLNINFN